MPVGKGVEILFRNAEIRAVLKRLEEPVHAGRRDVFDRFSVKELLELDNVVAGEKLLLLVLHLEIVREVLLLAEGPAAGQVVRIHDAENRDKGK